MSDAVYDVIVIGSGMTGLTASKELARRGVSVAHVDARVFGGLIINVNEIEGEFGGSGADLASTLMMEASDLGCAMLSEAVAGLQREADGLVVVTDAARPRARALIVAAA